MSTNKQRINSVRVGHPHEDRKPKVKISTIFVHIALILLVIINIFPLYWMLTFSLKSNDEIQGHSSTLPVTRWEEVDDSLKTVIGNMYTIQWGRIQDKVWSSVRTPLTTGGLFETAEKVDQLKADFDNKWNSGLRDDIASIDGLLDEDRTDDLKNFAADAIMKYGSLDEFFKANGGKCYACNAKKPGYFLLIARKKA